MQGSVCLVTMPWQSLDLPCLPIGLLTAAAVADGLPRPASYHANLRWVEFLLERTCGELGPAAYQVVADFGLFHEIGDWVFTGVLHDDPDFGVATLREYAAERKLDIDDAVRMREHADAFVDLVVAELLDRQPTLVGFTSTFMQNVPSLAVAKRLKQADPRIKTVLGGGNCDGPMGPALHRNYSFLDFTVSGEGERAFPALVRALESGGGSFAEIPGLSWRDTAGTRHVNAAGPPIPISAIPTPDYDDWFATLEASPINEYIEPNLVIETARGCWWGEKHHCTFCGLNGTLMEFRSKSPDAVLAELTSLVRRHQTLDVIVVDNIIDNGYFTTVLPRIAELGWDLRIHYEVKANLKPAEIAAFRDARVAHVQPGIESLVSPVLALMDKGVSAVRNVRTIRDGESAGLTVSWNWLYGFPGERFADYRPVMDQLPRLVHLQPPDGMSRILLERFSPYFKNPALGFVERTTGRPYRHVYRLDEADMSDMVYMFDTPNQGLNDDESRELKGMVDRWRAGYPDSSLVRRDEGTSIIIEDRRVGWPTAEHRIDSPELCAAYRCLDEGRSVPGLRRRLEARGYAVADDKLAAWLAELASHGLVFEENGQWISLATTTVPIKVV